MRAFFKRQPGTVAYLAWLLTSFVVMLSTMGWHM